MHARTHARTLAYTCDERTQARSHAHTHALAHACTRARTHARTHTHTRARAHTHTTRTGPIDAYFDHRLGALEYRSLRFNLTVIPEPGYALPAAVVNYPTMVNISCPACLVVKCFLTVIPEPGYALPAAVVNYPTMVEPTVPSWSKFVAALAFWSNSGLPAPVVNGDCR